MNNENLFEKIMTELRTVMPSGLTRDIEKNVGAAVTGVLSRLNLVTREEMEVQVAVLERTRARLEALEKQVAALENTLLKK